MERNMWNSNVFMTRQQIRELDRLAIEELGIPGPVLMENAGRGAADLICSLIEDGHAKVAVVAGAGNNGGDGFVVARHLLNRGISTKVFLASAREKIKGDAGLNLMLLEKSGLQTEDVTSNESLSALLTELKHSDVVVDALLGTGLSREVKGHFRDLIEVINSCGKEVVSLDMPSGLDADRGISLGVCVEAGYTVTFGHLKTGLVTYPGAALAGNVHVVDIGVPSGLTDRAGKNGVLLDETGIRSLFNPRAPDAHKGHFGHLLVLAGSMGKTGAAALCGKSAMRSGAGLVTIATTGEAQSVLESKSLETMVDNVIERHDSPLSEKAVKKLEDLMEAKAAFAVGPGLGTSPGISALAMKLIEQAEVPCVVDADGVNILAAQKLDAGSWKFRAPVILTPHPGEMSRLNKQSVRDIQSNRISTAGNFARDRNVIVVLKGANTVIAAPDGEIFVSPTGNPGMASGGSGDVLTGIIGSFLSQGMNPVDAACAGVFLHGLAADSAADRIGETGLVAGNIMEEVPLILREWEQNQNT